MYTIFINESVLYLAREPLKDSTIIDLEYDDVRLEDIIERAAVGELKSICIFHDDLDELWGGFKNQFTIIEAAGGLVFNEKNETLWIYRHGKWDLPKGKLEKHENLEEAALREVIEECGVEGLQLKASLPKTYHVYNHKGKRILKITHWYKMFANSDQNLKPQFEEHITDVKWMDTTNVQNVLADTYNNINLLYKFAAL